jgi:hypothetical protein
MNDSAATALANSDRTFFSAFVRANEESRSAVSTASMSTPPAAPKYPT